MFNFKKIFGSKVETATPNQAREGVVEDSKDSVYDIFLQSAKKNIIPEDRINLNIKDCRIFVLEDFEDVKVGLENVFKQLGIPNNNICFAKDVEEAKKKRGDNHFDLVILDHNITHKKLTGSDFLMWLIQEKYPDGNNRPVIMGNSSWFSSLSESQKLFFNNPFMQDQLKKELLLPERLAERMHGAMDKMNIDLSYDQ